MVMVFSLKGSGCRLLGMVLRRRVYMGSMLIFFSSRSIFSILIMSDHLNISYWSVYYSFSVYPHHLTSCKGLPPSNPALSSTLRYFFDLSPYHSPISAGS